MAVAYDANSLEEMLQSVDLIGKDCPVEIYTGYWKKEGKWVSIDKGEEMKWAKWSKYSPFESCATIPKNEPEPGTFTGNHCEVKSCPVCYFEHWPSLMMMKGVSLDHNIDTFYYLLNQTHLIGQSK